MNPISFHILFLKYFVNVSVAAAPDYDNDDDDDNNNDDEYDDDVDDWSWWILESSPM